MDNEDTTNPAEAEDASEEAEVEDAELDQSGNPVEAEAEAEPEEELEEIERDGKTYKIPAALKPELMMQTFLYTGALWPRLPTAKCSPLGR